MFIEYLSDRYTKIFSIILIFNLKYNLYYKYSIIKFEIKNKSYAKNILSNINSKFNYRKIKSYINDTKHLPQSLKILKIGYTFNQPIDDLSKNIKKLKLGYGFDQSVDELPQGLKKLTLRTSFYQPINNLPVTLVELNLGFDFNRSIDHLSNLFNLKKLTLGVGFNQPINKTILKDGHPTLVGILPQNLEILTLPDLGKSIIDLPKKLKKLKKLTLCCLKNFSLKIGDYQLTSQVLYKLTLDHHTIPLVKLNLDDTIYLNNFHLLKRLTLEYFNQPINFLPYTLEELYLGINFNQPIDYLSNLHSLKKLTLGRNFDQPINDLPQNLKILIIKSILFHQTIDNLPRGLKKLNIKRINGKIPDSLKTLKFIITNYRIEGSYIIDKYHKIQLPKNLKVKLGNTVYDPSAIYLK